MYSMILMLSMAAPDVAQPPLVVVGNGCTGVVARGGCAGSVPVSLVARGGCAGFAARSGGCAGFAARSSGCTGYMVVAPQMVVPKVASVTTTTKTTTKTTTTTQEAPAVAMVQVRKVVPRLAWVWR